MALNLPGVPFKLNAQDMGGFDLGASLRQGFGVNEDFQKSRFLPKTLSENLLTAQLGNKIKGVEAKYAEQLAQAKIAHENALKEKALRGPAIAYNNLEKALQGQERVIKQYGEDSPQARAAQMYVDHMANGAKGGADKFPTNKVGQILYLQQHPELIPDVANEDSHVQSIFPNTQNQYQPTKKPDLNSMLLNALNTQGKESAYQGPAREAKDLERLKQEVGENSTVYQQALRLSAMKEKTADTMNKRRERQATGLKPGEDYVYSPEDKEKTNPIAIRRPYEKAEKKEQSGRNFFNVVYPAILKSTSYYSGAGSIKRFNDDVANYNTDKKAQKRVDNYLTAIQLLPAAMVKENATVGGANTNQVYNRLIKSLNSSDLPIKLEELEKQFRLPRGAKLRSGIRFQETLNRATKAGEKIPSRTTEYLSGDHEGYMYNKKTGKVEHHLVSPQDWDAFREAGGY